MGERVRRITRELLDDLPGRHRGVVSATEDGVVAGLALLDADAVGEPAGSWTPLLREGDRARAGEPILDVEGSAWEVALAQDHVLGVLGTAGGMARRALELRAAAPAGLRIACGGWKKLPAAMKPVLRAALDVAEVTHRLVDGPFVYIDKNAVQLLDGIEGAVRAGLALDHGPVAVQVAGTAEAHVAVSAGAGIVMVDTGDMADLAAVDDALRRTRTRGSVLVAFAGGVTGADLDGARSAGADIVDVGRAILDAPLWDVHLQVESIRGAVDVSS